MATIFPRSEWTTSPHGAVDIKVPQKYIFIHYPASEAYIGRESQAQTVLRLRGYRNGHLNQGYVDIAYNWAVDQSGRIWELRGRRQCGANGGSATNQPGQAILCLVSNTETPSRDLIDGVRECIKYIREWQPTAGLLYGHRQSWEAETQCPGEKLMGLLNSGAFGLSFIPPNTEPPVVIPTAPDNEEDVTYDPGQIDVSLEVEVDGRFGTSTVAELQRRLGVTVDGKAGHGTWRALQRFLGTTIDGIVSNQSYRAEELGNGITQGWDYQGPGSSGSSMVRALQHYVGVTADGIWFEGTTAALQRKLNSSANTFR